MDREQARQTIRESWRQILPGMTGKAKQNVNGEPSYICPFCGHGKGGDGLTFDPKSKDGNNLKCFGGCGFSGDILDLYQKKTGADYNTALFLLAQEIGITIDRYEPRGSGWPVKKYPTPAQKAAEATESGFDPAGDNLPADKEKTAENTTEDAAGADYTEYYKQCRQRLNDPAAIEYLNARGISLNTAAAYYVGFDPAADPAGAPGATGDEYRPHPVPRLIFPASKDFYTGRRIDGKEDYRYINAAGGRPAIFNRKTLYDNKTHEVFINEGAIDALSIIEAGGAAVALNSKSNADIFLQALKEKPTKAVFIICLDNDEAGQKGAETIREGLRKMNLPFIGWNVSGDHKDPNEALIADRDGFIARVKAAKEAAEALIADQSSAGDNLPTSTPEPEAEGAQAATEPQEVKKGILTPERARAILEAVDDHFIELKNFPQLANALKLRTHDTVVIAADTGAGKSSLSLNILHELQDRYPALYVNLEMDEATVLQRLIAIHTGIELDIIEGYKHDAGTREKVNAALDEILARKEIQLINDIYDLKKIEAQIQAATVGRKEPTMVFIDTGLLVTLPNKSASRYERFTQISEELRRISRLYNIVMFVLLQQSREGKKEEQKAPTNSSLKESGSWENDATKIMFLWNNPQTKKKELVITKNRNGKSGSVQLEYSPHTQTYKESKGGFIPLSDDTLLPEEWAGDPARKAGRKPIRI